MRMLTFSALHFTPYAFIFTISFTQVDCEHTTVFIAPPSKPPLYIFNLGYFDCQNGRFFVVFRLHRVHLGDSSIYFNDFLLLVEDDRRPVWGCFFPRKTKIAQHVWCFLIEDIFFYSSCNFQYDILNRDWKKNPKRWHKFRKLRGFTALYARKRAWRAC